MAILSVTRGQKLAQNDSRIAIPGFTPVAITALKLCTIRNKYLASVRSGPFSQMRSIIILIDITKALTDVNKTSGGVLWRVQMMSCTKIIGGTYRLSKLALAFYWRCGIWGQWEH